MPSLGTSNLGSEVLSGSVTYVSVDSTSVVTDEQKLNTNTRADAVTQATASVTGTKGISSVSISPENLYVQFNENGGEFQSNWFTKETPLEDTGELVLVGSFRNERFDPVKIIIERDDTGDEIPDIQSEVQTLNDGNHILRVSEGDRGEDIAKSGASYRLRFPDYNQTDAIDRLTLALAWDSEKKFHQEWDIGPVDTESEPVSSLIAVLLSENYRFDATLDQIAESHKIETASGKSLEYHSHEVGVVRKENENDPHLRKRVLAKSATRTFSSTGKDVTDLIGLIFDNNSDKISIETISDRPVMAIEVPQTVMEDHILSANEIKNLLDESVASSYNIQINTI